ncbi:rna methyltransferase-like protein 1-like protein [Lasius niger]|uniref:Rna methyltransferase-like protein 1-like protein n=1 Tax=Lasius niger TaxID=67767 RepID=A0A0J7KZE5_LASNI|nr:rna methyltransferase-like protein 1-like protein [Lasius niger]
MPGPGQCDKCKKTTKTKIHKKAIKTRKDRPKTRKEKEKKKEEKENKVGEAVTTEQGYTCHKADDKLVSSLMIDVKTRNKREKNNRIFEIPDAAAKKPANDTIPLTIICDNIREPGNLGTIVRAAAAVGCEKLVLMKGCTDLWDSKVLRSAVGAHFRVPIHTSVSWDEIPTLISNESMIFLADNNVVYENKLRDDTVNPESNISTFIEADDNNVKQDDYDANSDQIVENDKSIKDAVDELLDQVKSHKPTAKTKSLMRKLISQLPVEPYYKFDFTKREMVLIIGGETEGVSLESCKLLHARNCVRVNVPLTNGVDSLNVGVAVGIVTFEMKRQFVTRNINDE